MTDEIAGISRIAVDPTNRDQPRRESSRQQERRKPPKPAAQPEEPKDDEPRVVGSRLNVRA
jgi:hypothetical protein